MSVVMVCFVPYRIMTKIRALGVCKHKYCNAHSMFARQYVDPVQNEHVDIRCVDCAAQQHLSMYTLQKQ